ncbi:metallophosphoesterase family protein [Aliiruegeria lutimaris]|uniref:DNA repair exonuclease SbcCD nuclease subunit n=1 Tax=Aliiruegeria lutimaris TaxID=571298 RepID=A0A1G8WXM4_9RHOB|nr:DNA repair exonuclease [Aliiruegeria lutimaris]SDJ82961.1 DNA repair exonuclease SbcCD nuclease subunit [Aliiruegeria lutimaris]
MPSIRFVHTSDLHLGKRFGTMPDTIRSRLVEARHESIARVADVARSRDARHVLVAGDTFDTETPSDNVRVQALAAMGSDPDLSWWIIPGNHDSLSAETLWERVEVDAPSNVRVLTKPELVEIAPQVFLLPAPLPHRFPGRDLTDWMPSAESSEGALRIGLAHGRVQSFHEDADTRDIIPPNRAASAGLDYLALGDWHGALTVDQRTHYSGTPERDRFKHNGPGSCLVVTLDGGTPEIETIETGRFDWQDVDLTLTPDADVGTLLSAHVPEDAVKRRDMLLTIRANGTLRLPEKGKLITSGKSVADSFGLFRLLTDDLTTEVEAGDLDAIATGGALRSAADLLRNEAENEAASETDRLIAARALDRLWTLAQEDV